MKNNLVLFIGLIILALKVLIIDMDPPKWELAKYQPIDEVYYVNSAYNYFESNTLFGKDEPVFFGKPLMTNLITYYSLVVFGDNYLGLRFSSLLFSIISFIFFTLILKKLTNNFRLQLTATLFLTLNFSFTAANIIVEPTIARIMAALIALFLVISWNEKKDTKAVNIIWQSFLIGLLFLYSYPTNAFIVLASYITLIVIKQSIKANPSIKANIKIIIAKSIYFIIGILISLLTYYVFALLFGVDLIEDTISRGGKYDDRVGLNLKGIIQNILSLNKANIFTINPILPIITIVSIISLFSNRLKSVNPTIIAIIIFLFSFLLQSVFINDYPQRKLIMLLPFVILLVIGRIQVFIEKGETLSKWSVLVIFLIVIGVSVIQLYLSSLNGTVYLLPWITTVIGILVLLHFSTTKGKKKIIPYVFFLLLLLPELYYSIDHYLIKRPYEYKKTFESLSVYNGSNFIGGFSMGFRPYNKIIPNMSFYNYYGRMDIFWSRIDSLSRNGKKDYSIDFKENEAEFRKIGFKASKVLMTGEQTVDGIEWVLYEKIIIK